jgi:hypothetical protein
MSTEKSANDVIEEITTAIATWRRAGTDIAKTIRILQRAPLTSEQSGRTQAMLDYLTERESRRIDDAR